MVAAFLSSEGGPAANHERARAQRAEALTAAEARLDPDAREQLQGLLDAMHDYVPVVEDRARWQLAAAGAVRPVALALGAKLVASGALGGRDDVFFLHTDELARLAAGQLPEARDVVAERRNTLERAARLVPPASLGAPLPAGFEQNPMFAKMFGFGAARPVTGNVVHGIGVSRGTFRGRARVVLDLDDADRVEPGDVLVCPFTAPPWTPLFAIAGAVVTDVGGVLSHSAIAAREYAIPCVSGTGSATRAIPDGAVVTVDGAAGTVVIEA
jgi:pyruvate,water dikinase